MKLLAEHGVTMRRQPLTPDQINQAAKLYADGNSLRTIAVQLDSSFSTVREALIARGVQMRPARK
ncbi:MULTISPECIES: helix-turn-helix domain-containing protein [Nocardia]|uniref:helix-turn-helix domain-containing protein n=1 Tax=Nocardia TaxID=1817 RepID=UPI0007A520A7|nr:MULTISPECIES: helix-turn-helix domain-containing protein [Nocardia]MBF6276367.1 helix-turn-helix domain-containing protein [Nocardia nova]